MQYFFHFLLEHNSDALDVVNHIRVADLMKYGKIECIWEQQIVNFDINQGKNIGCKIIPSDERQVNVGPVFDVAFGARAVQNRLFNLRIAGKDSLNFFNRRFFKSKTISHVFYLSAFVEDRVIL